MRSDNLNRTWDKIEGAACFGKQSRRLRLFKAIELWAEAEGGVTKTAMELGHGSSPAFIYALRMDMGCGPQTYMRGHGPDRAAFVTSRAGGVSL